MQVELTSQKLSKHFLLFEGNYMLKVKNGKKEIFCDSISNENGSIKIFGVYNKTFHKESDGIYSPRFVQSGYDKLIINPVDVEVEEFDVEEYTLKCLMDYVKKTISLINNRIEMRERHIGTHEKFLNKHSGKWYSWIIKFRIAYEQELVESYTKNIAVDKLNLNRFESLRNITNSKDLIELLKEE